MYIYLYIDDIEIKGLLILQTFDPKEFEYKKFGTNLCTCQKGNSYFFKFLLFNNYLRNLALK